MGRKSALTPDQWVEVERLHFIDGVSVNSLAKRFGVNESVIRRKIKPNKAEAEPGQESLRDIALRKVEADAQARRVNEQIAELPIARQNIVVNLSKKLTAISEHLAGAAEFGAATAHRLAGIAHGKVQEIDDADPFAADSMESLKGVTVLMKMANEAAVIPTALLNANKDTVKRLNEPDETEAPKGSGVLVVPGLMADSGAWSKAARAKDAA